MSQRSDSLSILDIKAQDTTEEWGKPSDPPPLLLLSCETLARKWGVWSWAPLRSCLVTSGPVLRASARLSQRFPLPLVRYGVWSVSTWPIWVRYPPPPSMHTWGAIHRLNRGISAILAQCHMSDIPSVLLGIPWPALSGPLQNHYWNKRRPQPYWGGENSGNALEASNALNYRVGGPSRSLKGNSRKRSESVSGVFPEFFRNFFREVPAVLGVWPTMKTRQNACIAPPVIQAWKGIARYGGYLALGR